MSILTIIKTKLRKIFSWSPASSDNDPMIQTVQAPPPYGTLNSDPIPQSTPPMAMWKKCLRKSCQGLKYTLVGGAAAIITLGKGIASGGQRIFAILEFMKSRNWTGAVADTLSYLMGFSDTVIMLATRAPAIFKKFWQLFIHAKTQHLDTPPSQRKKFFRRLLERCIAPFFTPKIHGFWKRSCYALITTVIYSGVVFAGISGFLGAESLTGHLTANSAALLSMGTFGFLTSAISLAIFKVSRTIQVLEEFLATDSTSSTEASDSEETPKASPGFWKTLKNIFLGFFALLDAVSQYLAFMISQEDLLKSLNIQEDLWLTVLKHLFSATSTIQYAAFNWQGLFHISWKSLKNIISPSLKNTRAIASIFVLFCATVCQALLAKFNTKNAVLAFEHDIGLSPSASSADILAWIACAQYVPLTILGSGALVKWMSELSCPSISGMFRNLGSDDPAAPLPLLYPFIPGIADDEPLPPLNAQP